MVIQPGAPWGERGDPPIRTPEAADESELGALWLRGVREAVLRTGTLRSATGSAEQGGRICADVDALLVEIECGRGVQVVAAFGTMVVGTGLFGTRTAAIATNSGFWRCRRVLPAAHPNDGFLDVLEISTEMGSLQRCMAWRRAARVDHLPHPQLAVRRGTAWTWSGGPCTAWIDGRRWTRAVHVACTVLPDAMRVWL